MAGAGLVPRWEGSRATLSAAEVDECSSSYNAQAADNSIYPVPVHVLEFTFQQTSQPPQLTKAHKAQPPRRASSAGVSMDCSPVLFSLPLLGNFLDQESPQTRIFVQL